MQNAEDNWMNQFYGTFQTVILFKKMAVYVRVYYGWKRFSDKKANIPGSKIIRYLHNSGLNIIY